MGSKYMAARAAADERVAVQIQALADSLARVVKKKIEEREWRRVDLAFEAGVSLSFVDKLLSGRIANPELDTQVRLAGAFEQSLQDFWAEVEREADGAGGALVNSNANSGISNTSPRIPVLAMIHRAHQWWFPSRFPRLASA